MRFHVLALPHTVTSKQYCSCAYTQKVLNFCKMMMSFAGNEVFHYGGEGSDVPCTEHITIMPKEMRDHWWGNNNTSREHYAFDYDPARDYWQYANRNAVEAMKSRVRPRDFICVIAGICQQPVSSQFPEAITVEYGIGYEGVFAPFKVFESYAHMHYMYGKLGVENGRYYDEVIPNYYDVKQDFDVQPMSWEEAHKPGGYYLFVGRLIERKGLHIAVQACRELGARLLVAGQGIEEARPGYIKAGGMVLEAPGLEYIGTVDVKQRAKLMAGALALFAPTQYIGPFEGVTAEAMLCGTPVITTDWGCYAENVEDGVSGFRTRSLGEMMWAAKEVRSLQRGVIRGNARKRWDINVIRHRYYGYFERLQGLYEPGKDWNTLEYNPMQKREFGHFR